MAQTVSLPSTELTDITGALGVGAVNMLSLFLVLDATANAFAVVEENAQSASWVIFVTVPILVASYVVGIVMIALGATLRSLVGGRPKLRIHAAMIRHPDLREHLAQEYRQFTRKRELLEGMLPTALIAAAAIWLEAITFGYRALGVGLIVFALIGAFLCILVLTVSERDFASDLTSLESIRV